MPRDPAPSYRRLGWRKPAACPLTPEQDAWIDSTLHQVLRGRTTPPDVASPSAARRPNNSEAAAAILHRLLDGQIFDIGADARRAIREALTRSTRETP